MKIEVKNKHWLGETERKKILFMAKEKKKKKEEGNKDVWNVKIKKKKKYFTKITERFKGLF